MRSGLLTLGVILLVLGAIFYFIPGPASATDTTTTSNTDRTIGQQTTTDYGQQTTTTTDTTTTGGSDTTTGTGSSTDNNAGNQQQSVNTPVAATIDNSADGTTTVVDSADTTPTRTTTTQTTTNPTVTQTTTPVVDTDTTRTASSSVTTGVSGDVQRQLAIAAIILGALLTILGLVLPDPARGDVYVNQSARTPGPASRRVVYERDEERRKY